MKIRNRMAALNALIILTILSTLYGCSTSVPKTTPSDRDGPPSSAPKNLHLVPDAVPKVEPLSKYGNKFKKNNTYVVKKKRYKVSQTSRGYKERGTASWYGKKFHGRKTSSGEVYNMYAMTAAHRTLPLPTYARVTNLENGKSVVVKINDRGPFHKNRLIDLSYVAAHKLGVLAKGTSHVQIESIDPRDNKGIRFKKSSTAALGSGIAPGVNISTPTLKSSSALGGATVASSKKSKSKSDLSGTGAVLEYGQPSYDAKQKLPAKVPVNTSNTIQPINKPIAKTTDKNASDKIKVSGKVKETSKVQDTSKIKETSKTKETGKIFEVTEQKNKILENGLQPLNKTDKITLQPSDKKASLQQPPVASKAAATVTTTRVQKTEKPKKFYLQLGSYPQKKSADDVVNKISKASGHAPKIIETKQKNTTHYQVRLGPLSSEDEAVKITQKLATAKVPVAKVIKE